MKRLHFSNFWTSFRIGLYICKIFWTVVGLEPSFKKQDWIAKYDSPLISVTSCGKTDVGHKAGLYAITVKFVDMSLLLLGLLV